MSDKRIYSFNIQTGKENLIRIDKEWPAGGYLEIGSSHFSLNSAVFLPHDAGKNLPGESEDIYSSGIVMLERTIHFLELTKKKLLIAGHADTLGDPKKNVTLSEYRAKSVYSVLVGDRGLFKTVSNAPHITDKEKKNKTLHNDKVMISEWAAKEFNWPCTLKENNNDFIRAFKAFQRSYNEYIITFNPEGELLAVDGDWGPKTWGAVFDCYEYMLAKRLTIHKKDLNEYRSKIDLENRFVFDSNHFVACGEYHPIEGPDVDEKASQVNRRVEMIFFDEGLTPEITCVSSACNGRECRLYKSMQSVRGKTISARWENPLVLAGHTDTRKMMAFHAGANPGEEVTFTVVLVCEGELKKLPDPKTVIVSAGLALAEFEELSENVQDELKDKEGEVFYSYFFIAKGDDWMTVSARLHAEQDGAIYE